jgi:hypothetical protein
MKNELDSCLKLMHDLVDAVPTHMVFDVHFSVGFKFLIKPLHWSDSGRLLSTRDNYYSVVWTLLLPAPFFRLTWLQQCNAIGHFDSRLGVEGDVIDIRSVTPVGASVGEAE